MARIDVSTNKFSALVKKEIWREENWCRKDVTLTVDKSEQIGLVVYLDSGKYIPLTETKMAAWDSATDKMAILIDERVETEAAVEAADIELAVMYRGMAILSKAAVSTSSDTPVTTSLEAMYTVFEANEMEFADNLTNKTVSKV